MSTPPPGSPEAWVLAVAMIVIQVTERVRR